MILKNIYENEISNEYSNDKRIILLEGDTLELLKTIPDETVKLIISSPPYNVGKKYENRISLEDYLKDKEKIILEFIRVLETDGSVCWEVGNYIEKSEVFPLDILYYNLFKKNNFKLRNRIIWHFGHGLHASKRFSGRYETILWFTKSDNYTFNLDDVRIPSKYPGKLHYKGLKKGQPSCNPLGKNPSDFWQFVIRDWEEGVWDIPNVKANHPEKTIHQCQFPIELVERCVLALTNEGDFVLDPYSGVGSTIIAALKQNRRAIGIEKESKYNDITRNRIRSFYEGKLKYRKLGKPVYKPTGKEKVTQKPKIVNKINQRKLE